MTYRILTHDDELLAERPDWVAGLLCAKVYAVLSGFPVTLDGPEGSSETIYPTEEGQ